MLKQHSTEGALLPARWSPAIFLPRMFPLVPTDQLFPAPSANAFQRTTISVSGLPELLRPGRVSQVTYEDTYGWVQWPVLEN